MNGDLTIEMTGSTSSLNGGSSSVSTTVGCLGGQSVILEVRDTAAAAAAAAAAAVGGLHT